MRVFLSAGEPSGDHHAAALIEQLRMIDPRLECVGLGGPRMEAAGCRLLADMTRLAVMWFVRVLASIHRFVELARRAERSFIDSPPDVLVMIDFPGFHWWLAWRAKRHGIPVVFYCPPQIWAWASWRAAKMRRLVDHVLAPLPFEQAWLSEQGIAATFVGHPFFDEKPKEAQAAAAPGAVPRPLVLLLPGSRSQEIESNLGTLVSAARRVREACPQAEFVVAAVSSRHAKRIRSTLGTAAGGIPVEAGRTRQLIGRATAAMAVSGSVSLELMAARVPAVIVYRVSGLAWVVQSWFRHARFITLVNLLAAREPIGPVRPSWWPPATVEPCDPEAVYPEYLAVRDPAERIAGHVIDWLTNPASRKAVVSQLDRIAATAAATGSARHAAEAVARIAAGGQPAAADTTAARVAASHAA